VLRTIATATIGGIHRRNTAPRETRRRDREEGDVEYVRDEERRSDLGVDDEERGGQQAHRHDLGSARARVVVHLGTHDEREERGGQRKPPYLGQQLLKHAVGGHGRYREESCRKGCRPPPPGELHRERSGGADTAKVE